MWRTKLRIYIHPKHVVGPMSSSAGRGEGLLGAPFARASSTGLPESSRPRNELARLSGDKRTYLIQEVYAYIDSSVYIRCSTSCSRLAIEVTGVVTFEIARGCIGRDALWQRSSLCLASFHPRPPAGSLGRAHPLVDNLPAHLQLSPLSWLPLSRVDSSARPPRA